MKRRRNRSWTNLAAAEALEDRSLLAGNVLASFEDGNLTLIGDKKSNHVEIVPTIVGVAVVGTDTTINGSTVAFALPAGQYSIPGNLKANMKRGNDYVRLAVGVDGNVEAKMGAGRDWFATQSSGIGGRVFINLGSTPRDTKPSYAWLTDSAVSGPLTIKGGGGPTASWLERTTAGTVSISLGGGQDSAVFEDSTVDSVFANGGGGRLDSFYELGSNIFQSLNLRGFE